LTIDEEAML